MPKGGILGLFETPDVNDVKEQRVEKEQEKFPSVRRLRAGE
jgi:hypothetical protein